jgi:hypothetical protein
MRVIRPKGRLRALAAAGALVAAVAGCTSEVPQTAPPPTPSPTPAPTPTPLPGQPLASSYRPEGEWEVAFSRPGDIVRETYVITMTCPDGTCDAIVEIRDAAGERIGDGRFTLEDGRYRYASTTRSTVDCAAGGRTVPRGATQEVDTSLVLATYRIAGTAREQQAIEGTRTITLEPRPDSGCAASTTVYPARGEPAGTTP